MNLNDGRAMKFRRHHKRKLIKEFLGVDHGKISSFSEEDRCEDREY